MWRDATSEKPEGGRGPILRGEAGCCNGENGCRREVEGCGVGEIRVERGSFGSREEVESGSGGVEIAVEWSEEVVRRGARAARRGCAETRGVVPIQWNALITMHLHRALFEPFLIGRRAESAWS